MESTHPGFTIPADRSGADLDESFTADMPRREQTIGIAAAGVLVLAVATLVVRGSDTEPGIDDPIAGPTSTVSESASDGVSDPTPTASDRTPAQGTETETTAPSETASPSETATATEGETGGTDGGTTGGTDGSGGTDGGTTGGTDGGSDGGTDGDGLDDMPDTGGGPLALLGGAVAAAGLSLGRRRST